MKRIVLNAVCRRLLTAIAMAVAALWPQVVSAQQQTCTPRQLPYATSFEEDDGGDACWTTMDSLYGYPQLYCYGYARTGSCAMALTAGGGTDVCMVASPRIAYRADSLHVGFWITMNDLYGTLQVGLLTDTASSTTFTALMNIDLATSPVGYYEFYTDGYASSDSVYVAFRLTNGRVVIDDFEAEAATLCRRPWHSQVGLVTNSSIALTWSNPGGNASSWLVRYIDTLVLDTSYLTVYVPQVIISALSAATPYRIDVAALCGGDTTAWMPAGVVTTDVACRQPVMAELESSTATAAILSWQHDLGGAVLPTAASIALLDVTASTPFGSAISCSDNYALIGGLTTGHSYVASVRAVCQTDTSAPVQVVFTPLADPCTEHSGSLASGVSVVNGATFHHYSQMLYPKEMLAGSDTLYGLALRVAENNMIFPRNLSFYIGQTTDSVLASNIVSALMNPVASGYVLDNEAEGWVVVPFASPLAVDTARNLVVAVLDNTGAPTGAITFGVHFDSYGGTLYAASQSMPFDPSTFDIPMISTSSVADIRLFGNCAMDACQPPAAAVTSCTDTSLTLQWVGGSGTVVVRCTAEGTSDTRTIASSANQLTITGLSSSTRYFVAVGSVCGNDTAFAAPMTSLTGCSAASVPYVADFSVGEHPCWQGTQSEVNGGIMLDGQLVSPVFNVPLGTLQMRLALRPTPSAAMMRVGVATADGTPEVWLDSLLPVDMFEDEWVVYLDEYTSTGSRLVIDADGGWLLQQATIEPLDQCLPPRRMTVSGVGADCATVSWQGDAAAYNLYFKVDGTDAWSQCLLTAPQCTFTGLAPQTSYIGYAVSLCSAAGTQSARTWFRFTTGCGTIRYFPYTQGFEDGDATIGCWSVVYVDPACASANPVSITTNRSYSGRSSLRFSSYNNVQSGLYDQYLISPRIVATDSIFLSLQCLKDNYDSEPFRVGLSVSDNNPDNFVWMDVIEPQAGQWTTYEIGLPSVVRYVAIRYMGQGNYYLYIDDLEISGPGCAAPHITMVDEQAAAVALRWEADADTAIVAITDGVWLSDVSGDTVVGNMHTFSGLQAASHYIVGVRFLCSDGRFSDWTTSNVSTIDPDCAVPVALAVDSVGFSSAVVSWSSANDVQHWQLCLMADGDMVWQSGRLTAPLCSIEGLEQNRLYSVKVRSYCSDIPGPWSDTLGFHTLECMPVGGVDFERIDVRTVSISWESPDVTTGRCRIEYGPEGFVRGTGNVVESASPCRIGGLDPYANNDFYIQNICEQGVLSDTAVLLQVPTSVGIDVAAGLQMTLTPNPASRRVVVGGLEPQALVELVDVSGRRIGVWTASSERLSIDLSQFARGTYFVRVATDGAVAVGKLIVR